MPDTTTHRVSAGGAECANRPPRRAGRTAVSTSSVVLLVVASCAHAARPVPGYRPSAQHRWTDKTSLYADPEGLLSMGGGGRRGRRTKRIDPQDKELLDQALDAFQQASSLETELKKSERAVSAQTKELKTELAKAKATARSTGQTAYFKREERLDKELMRQAEDETRRDKRLVDQAETEMRGDKKFLQTAYGIDDIDAYEARRQAKAASPDCGLQHCHQAKDSGLAPDKCVIGAGLCPQIQCYDYAPTTWCASKQVCERPARQRRNCFPRGPGRSSQWLKKTCPTMSCRQAAQLGYVPDFCTITMLDGTCPERKCFHYTDKGSCTMEDTGTAGVVCMKPAEADDECLVQRHGLGMGQGLAKSNTPRGGRSIRRGSGAVGMASFVGMHGMLGFIIFLSILAGSFFWLFRRYGAALAIKNGQKKPAPVPTYYGRL